MVLESEKEYCKFLSDATSRKFRWSFYVKLGIHGEDA